MTDSAARATRAHRWAVKWAVSPVGCWLTLLLQMLVLLILLLHQQLLEEADLVGLVGLLLVLRAAAQVLQHPQLLPPHQLIGGQGQ